MRRILAAAPKTLALAAAWLGAGCAISSLSGAFSNWADIVSHFAPLWGLLGVLALVLGAAVRSRLSAGLGVAASAGAALLMGPDVAAALRPESAFRPQLRLVQFNIWGRNRDPQATAAWILAQHPDVVVLQEAYGDTRQIVAALRRQLPYSSVCRTRPCSALIMSRAPPTATGSSAPAAGEAALPLAWARFGDERTGFAVIDAHFTWPIPPRPWAQQAGQLARTVRPLAHERLIVAGDFNSTPWSFGLRRLDGALGLPRRTHALFSWPAARFTRFNIAFPVPVMAIDQVYAGAGWRHVRVSRGPRLGSDHYPLLVELSAAS